MPRIPQKHIGLPESVSGAIYSYGYDPETLRFEVRYREGGKGASQVYQWKGVSAERVTEFEDAKSRGSYVSRFIQGQYESEVFELEPEPEYDAKAFWESLYAAKHRELPNESTPVPGCLMRPSPPEVAA